MSKTPQNTGEGNDLSPEKIQEILEKMSKEADLDSIVFYDNLHNPQNQQEFFEAESTSADKLTDDQLAEMEKYEAEISRQLEHEAKCSNARAYCQLGIKLKANDTDSTLFKTAEELLLIVDKVETDPSSVSPLELRQYKTDLSKYDTLLQAESVVGKAKSKDGRRIKAWFKNHPHSYGLTVGIIFLMLFFVLGLVKAQWRNWCWTAGLALLVLIPSLLGGKSSR